ncbi:MAG TPA: gluconate 2-dehydrogenase subunit 3 family protein [Terracidiphilus sp.]|nr:gluconate 2-dehydrogenase subunit 3 family protein [Terracidiphilus sp.]
MKEKKGALARRDFMIATAAAGTAILSGCFSPGNDGWEFLTGDTAATLKAICDRIVPADEFPSASEAGVLIYIDRQLTRHYRHHQKAYLAGLDQANRISRERFGAALESVSPQQQLAVVAVLESHNSAFFELVREHTLEGYYGSPRHGGNRDAVSWRMLGIDEPPLRGRAQFDLRKGSPS